MEGARRGSGARVAGVRVIGAVLEGVEFVKLKGEELESGGVEGSEALEGDGVAWSLGGDVGS